MEPTKKPFSIDFEPKTLNSDQMRKAREEALNLLNAESSKEAQRMFTEASEKAQENSTKDVNFGAQEVQKDKKDDMGADATSSIQKVKDKKMETTSSDDDNENFEEEFDSFSSDGSLLSTLIIQSTKDAFLAPF